MQKKVEFITKLKIQMPVGDIQTPQHVDHSKNPRYKSYAHVILIVVNLCLSNFYFGYVLSYINTIPLASIIKTFGITMDIETARGVLNGCIPVGAGVGALVAKKLTHMFSRRNFVLLTNLIAVIAGSLIYITNMGVFLAMRLIQGLCIGFFTSTISVYINEISPVQVSGSTGSFTQIFVSMGVTTAYLFYYILSVAVPKQAIPSIWYYVFGFPMIPLVIQSLILVFVFPYQTPKYYLVHHDKVKARQLIAEIYKQQFVDQILRQKMQDLQEVNEKEVKRQSVIIRKQSLKNLPAQNNPAKTSLAKLPQNQQQQQQISTPPLAKFSAFHLHILRQFVGINAVIAYGGTIISKSNPSLQPIVPIILNFQAMVGAILSIFILARIGRKAMIQFGTFSLSIALLLITIGFFIQDQSPTPSNGLILAGLFSYMFIYGMSIGTIVWLYLAQIAQPSIISYATLVTWCGAAVVMVLFPIIKSNLPQQNPSYLFLFFLVWTSISFAVNHFALIQTKGKTEHQIHAEYTNRNLRNICCNKTIEESPADNQQSQANIRNENI